MAQTFLDLVELLHSWGAFLVYAGFSAVGGVWMYYYLPETMNLSLEEVATLFRDPYPAPLRGQQDPTLTRGRRPSQPVRTTTHC